MAGARRQSGYDGVLQAIHESQRVVPIVELAERLVVLPLLHGVRGEVSSPAERVLEDESPSQLTLLCTLLTSSIGGSQQLLGLRGHHHRLTPPRLRSLPRSRRADILFETPVELASLPHVVTNVVQLLHSLLHLLDRCASVYVTRQRLFDRLKSSMLAEAVPDRKCLAKLGGSRHRPSFTIAQEKKCWSDEMVG